MTRLKWVRPWATDDLITMPMVGGLNAYYLIIQRPSYNLIVNENGIDIDTIKNKSLASAKTKGKRLLIKYGVKFYDEVRNQRSE
jgi:hypothetical protein